jgi:hypothetical protein
LHSIFQSAKLSRQLFACIPQKGNKYNYSNIKFSTMGIIKERFKLKADAANAEIKDLLKEHGDKKSGEVTLAQIYQGTRGITGLVSETSL